MNHGYYALADDYPYSVEKSKVFIDLSNIEDPAFDSVKFSALQAPETRPFAWNIGKQIDEAISKEGIDIISPEAINNNGSYEFTKNPADNLMFWDLGMATLIIGTESNSDKGKYDLDDIGHLLLEIISQNNY